MTMNRIMARNKVAILQEQQTKGSAGGIARSFTFVRWFTCSLIPAPSSDIEKLGLVASEVPHQMFSVADPQLTNKNRIQFNGAVMRVRGDPNNPHTMGRFYVTNLICKSDDNGVPINGVPTELP